MKLVYLNFEIDSFKINERMLHQSIINFTL